MNLNLFKVTLPFSEFQIQERPYSHEDFNKLKDTYNHEASFFRHSNTTFISPSTGFDEQLGTIRNLKVNEHPEVVRSLVRHILFRAFREDQLTKDMLPEKFSPLTFFSRKEQHDPIRKHLPKEVQKYLQYPRVNEVYVKSICPNEDHTFGIVIKARHAWRLNRSLTQIVEDGYDIKGRTIVESLPYIGLEGVLADDESVLGEIISYNSTSAEIQTNKGVITRNLSSLSLQKTSRQLEGYLKATLGSNTTDSVFSSIRQDRSSTTKSVEFDEIYQLARWFSSKKYENNDGFCFKIAKDPIEVTSSLALENTRLVFDISPGASKPSVLSGLRNHGPFDSSRYPNKKFRILALFHNRNHGSATSFLGKLINGIPDSQYFQSGLKDLFRLHSVEFILKPLASNLPEAYEEAITQAIREDTENDGYHIALVECPDNSHVVPIAHNPYYCAKASLMNYGIPVQCVKEEHLRAGSYKLSNTLGPMALQMYSKTGGIPWILPSSQSVDAELVIGLGHSVYRKNQWTGAEQSRVVGLTTFFNGDGRYLMGQESRTVPYDDYFEELLNSLKRSLKLIAEEYNWKENQTVRLVFHIFKPLKNVEIEVVEKLTQELGFNVLFAFVTISRFHPWIQLSGLRRTHKGFEIEPSKRGENVVLDKHSCLLQIKGDTNRPNQRQGFPLPVLVKIHDKSTYKDLQYITQQVLDFSYLNWRSFFPSDLPAPIFYSSLMAQMSQKLDKVNGWNPTMLDRHFRRKTWFL